MALSEFETKKFGNAVAAFIEQRRPPPHIRPKVDLAYRISDQSIEIYEIRPVWDEPSMKMEHPVAKATYVKSHGIWKVYCMRADLKWHSYPPAPKVSTVEMYLSLVGEDKHACFFG